MKNNIVTRVLLLGITGLMACTDDSPKATLKSNVAPNELQNLSGNNFVLTLDMATATFEEFKWTKTDFGFASSTTYTVQLDKATNNFASPLEIATVNNKLSASISVSDMNKKLLEMGLEPEVATDIKVRVASTISDKVSTVFSNSLTVTVTPYATSFPPIYMVGEGLNGWSWNAGIPVEMPSSAPKIYETIAKFNNGKAFRFFAQQDWWPTSYNYPFFTTVDNTLVNANDGDSNLKFTGATGYYKVNVNLKTKTVSMLAVAEPVLYMTGAAINGWSWDPGKPVKMTYVKPGVFTATTTFTNDTFRFFAQADWGPTSYNYPYFATVDARFENANDGDKNLRFIGTTGSYTITVDLTRLSVAMTP